MSPRMVRRLTIPSPAALARMTAAGALLLFFFTAVAIVVAGTEQRPLAERDARFIAERLVEVDQKVRTRLVRLGPPGTVARTRRGTREAVAQLDSLGRSLDGAGGPAAARLRTAIAAEVRFLDAVGSVLVNPGSPLLAQLERLDVAARAALARSGGPQPRRKGGVTALQRLWRERAAAQT
jgi:hypothetical protein